MENQWLNLKEAVRQAFKYRNRSRYRGLPNPILITDFHRKNLRVIEVTPGPGEWDNWEAWTAIERPMTDDEARYLDWWAACPTDPCRRIGSAINKDGKYHTIGYLKRPGAQDNNWTIMIDVDQVNGTMNYSDFYDQRCLAGENPPMKMTGDSKSLEDCSRYGFFIRS